MNDQTSSKRLRKSASNRVIDGICGGVATYLDIDATLVRIGWILLALAGGVGILLYLAAMVIMPSPSITDSQTKPTDKSGLSLIAGIFLVAAGILWLLGAADLVPLWSIASFSWKALLPLLLVIAGLFLLLNRRPVRNDGPVQDPAAAQATAVPRRLYRSRRDRKLFGICGGLGEHLGLDPVFVRILFIAFAIASFGLALLAYLLLAILVPEEPFHLSSDWPAPASL